MTHYGHSFTVCFLSWYFTCQFDSKRDVRVNGNSPLRKKSLSQTEGEQTAFVNASALSSQNEGL